jgi:hypothetical protein
MDGKLNFYGMGFFHGIFVAIEDISWLGTSHEHPWASSPSIMSSTFLDLLRELKSKGFAREV